MPDQVQYRGGTASENDSFTGAAREVSVDTTNNTLRVHDGAKQGGFPLIGEAQLKNVDTLTDLKALSADDYAQVFMRGRDSIGDGAHGVFYWRSGDQSANITADPGEGVWVPPDSDTSGASGAWERLHNNVFSAHWWGLANPTNVATQLEQALEYVGTEKGEMHFIDLGTLTVDAHVQVSGGLSDCVLRFVNTTLKAGTGNHVMLSVEGSTARLKIYGLKLDGNADNKPDRNPLFNVYAATDCTFYDLICENSSGNAINLNSSNDASNDPSERCYFYNPYFAHTGRSKYGTTSAHINYNGNDLYVYGAYFGECNDNAIFLNSSENGGKGLFVFDCILEDCKAGINVLDDVENVVFDGVDVRGVTEKITQRSNTRTGTPAKNITIRNVKVQYSANDSFLAIVNNSGGNPIDGLEVAGCILRNNGNWGVDLKNVQNFSIHDNTIEGTQFGGIRVLDNCEAGRVYANTIRNTNQSGGGTQDAIDVRGTSGNTVKRVSIYANEIIDDQGTPTLNNGMGNNQYCEDVNVYNNRIEVVNGSPGGVYYDFNHSDSFYSWDNVPQREGAELVDVNLTVSAGGTATIYSGTELQFARVKVLPTTAAGQGVVAVRYTNDGTNEIIQAVETGGSANCNIQAQVERVGRRA